MGSAEVYYNRDNDESHIYIDGCSKRKLHPRRYFPSLFVTFLALSFYIYTFLSITQCTPELEDMTIEQLTRLKMKKLEEIAGIEKILTRKFERMDKVPRQFYLEELNLEMKLAKTLESRRNVKLEENVKLLMTVKILNMRKLNYAPELLKKVDLEELTVEEEAYIKHLTLEEDVYLGMKRKIERMLGLLNQLTPQILTHFELLVVEVKRELLKILELLITLKLEEKLEFKETLEQLTLETILELLITLELEETLEFKETLELEELTLETLIPRANVYLRNKLESLNGRFQEMLEYKNKLLLEKMRKRGKEIELDEALEFLKKRELEEELKLLKERTLEDTLLLEVVLQLEKRRSFLKEDFLKEELELLKNVHLEEVANLKRSLNF